MFLLCTYMSSYNNVATEITRLQKNMAALETLASTKNLAPPCPSENSGPPDSKPSPLPHKAIFFSAPPSPPSFLPGGVFCDHEHLDQNKHHQLLSAYI